MVELNMWIIPVAALIPLIMGFIWYNPKALGTSWMNAAGLIEEKMKEANMGLIFFLSYVFALFIAFIMVPTTIHQMGLQSMVMGADENVAALAQQVMNLAGNNYRTFQHGALHGTIIGIVLIFPILATNALFERKGWKYIMINSGYWIVSLALMGGVVCQFA